MNHPTDRITHIRHFVEHWLKREIAQWVHPMKDRSDNPSHAVGDEVNQIFGIKNESCIRVYRIQWPGAHGQLSSALGHQIIKS